MIWTRVAYALERLMGANKLATDLSLLHNCYIYILTDSIKSTNILSIIK